RAPRRPSGDLRSERTHRPPGQGAPVFADPARRRRPPTIPAAAADSNSTPLGSGTGVKVRTKLSPCSVRPALPGTKEPVKANPDGSKPVIRPAKVATGKVTGVWGGPVEVMLMGNGLVRVSAPRPSPRVPVIRSPVVPPNSKSYRPPPCQVMSATVSVPTPVPGARALPAVTVTGPTTVPWPASVWPLARAKPPLAKL